MKIVLGIITALTLFIGVMVNNMALSIGEQIYAALYYLMALVAFCTLSVILNGKFSCSCNWLRRECGLEEKPLDENEEEDEENNKKSFLHDPLNETIIISKKSK